MWVDWVMKLGVVRGRSVQGMMGGRLRVKVGFGVDSWRLTGVRAGSGLGTRDQERGGNVLVRDQVSPIRQMNFIGGIGWTSRFQ